jgi:hypothetical protein
LNSDSVLVANKYKILNSKYNYYSDSSIKAISSTDFVIPDTSILKLGNLSYNFGNIPVCIPRVGSFIINKGQPGDLSPAQNWRIQDGRRDIGAGEKSCVTKVYDTTFSCNPLNSFCSPKRYPNRILLFDSSYNYSTNCDTIKITSYKPIVLDKTITMVYPYIRSNENLATYQWLDCDNAYSVITGETSRYLTIPYNGSFAVELVKNGCVDTSDCMSINNVGMSEQSSDKISFLIYPNPNRGNFLIKSMNSILIYNIKIFDLNGRLIKLINEKKYSGEIINFEGESGIYFVRFEFKNNNYLYKLIKY